MTSVKRTPYIIQTIFMAKVMFPHTISPEKSPRSKNCRQFYYLHIMYDMVIHQFGFAHIPQYIYLTVFTFAHVNLFSMFAEAKVYQVRCFILYICQSTLLTILNVEECVSKRVSLCKINVLWVVYVCVCSNAIRWIFDLIGFVWFLYDLHLKKKCMKKYIKIGNRINISFILCLGFSNISNLNPKCCIWMFFSKKNRTSN